MVCIKLENAKLKEERGWYSIFSWMGISIVNDFSTNLVLISVENIKVLTMEKSNYSYFSSLLQCTN